MASKLIVSDTVIVPVKGSFSDDSGKQKSFKFSLVCSRRGTAELKDRLADKDTLFNDFVTEVTEGWDGVLVGLIKGDPLPFSDEGLESLLDVPGIGLLCFNAYMKEVGATIKN